MKYGDLKSYIDVAAELNCQAMIQPEAIKKIKRMLDDAEKYQWHDLRKNPEDLPEDGDVFVCCEHYVTKRRLYDYISYFGEFDVGNNWNVISWKYIDPFEEVEECTK